MNASIFKLGSELWIRFSTKKRDHEALEVLRAFITDAEHELLSLVTVLQAHTDLLKSERFINVASIHRFPSLNRAIVRLITVADFLASVSEQTQDIQPRKKVIVEDLMQEITADTKFVFDTNQVTLSYRIDQGAQLLCLAGPLKSMVQSVVLTVLKKCRKYETVNVTGRLRNRHLSLLFSTDLENDETEFKPWQLGKLRLIPTNGEGIGLAAVGAMARLFEGQLSMSTSSDERHGYKLSFAV